MISIVVLILDGFSIRSFIELHACFIFYICIIYNVVVVI
jgi:hypothetical protein